MSNKLSRNSRNVLNFRPNIAFIEPDQQEVPIQAPPEGLQPQDALERIRKVQKLADAVNVLASAVQAKVDAKAGNIKIKLDPKVDAQAIAAMKRMFPEDVALTLIQGEDDDGPSEDGIFITYDQYRQCKDNIRNYADEIALKARVTPEEIAAAKLDLDAGTTKIGGIGTPEAANGGLRPELEPKATIIEPLDIGKFQNYLIRILVNFIWKNFILKVLKAAIPLGGGNLLPKQLCKLPKDFKKQMSDIKKEGVQVL